MLPKTPAEIRELATAITQNISDLESQPWVLNKVQSRIAYLEHDYYPLLNFMTTTTTKFLNLVEEIDFFEEGGEAKFYFFFQKLFWPTVLLPF